MIGATSMQRENWWISLLRIYAFAIITTALIWALVAWHGGLQDTALVVQLTILEVVFSFDNATVNSKFLGRLSPFWQSMFMTVGIFFAVFVVRFALPVFIVQQSAHLSFTEVVDMALHHQAQYADYFSKASITIDTFGGAFLLTTGVSFLLPGKERIVTFLMLLVGITMYLTVPGEDSARASALIGCISGLTLHVGLQMLGDLLEINNAGTLVGLAAFVLTLRGEAIDASFSLDGVLGAFAITQSLALIMAGLGAGATWVRAMTVHIVRGGVLDRFPHLEHGAMAAVSTLGFLLLARRYGLETPDWLAGSIGLAFIATSLVTSIITTRRPAAT